MTYDIATREVAPAQVVSIRQRTTMAALRTFVGRAFGELYGRVALLGVVPDGEPFVVYHEFSTAAIDAEACVPVSGALTLAGRVRAYEFPGQLVASTRHIGPYESLGDAYEALHGWIRRNGFEAIGPVRERYLIAPGPGRRPESYQTEIEIPVAAALVAV